MKALWLMLVLIPSVCGCGGSETDCLTVPTPNCTTLDNRPGIQLAGPGGACIEDPHPECHPTFTALSASGIQVETQDGMGLSPQVAMAMVVNTRQAYEKKWGPVALTGWRFRFVSGEATPGHNSTTAWDGQLVTIGAGGAEWLSHELHHVQLGASSINHAGWCIDYEPWELATLGLDESSYLGCHS